MLNKEEIFYINILRDFANGNKTETVDDLDWQKILYYAKSQNTNGIVFNQCKALMPAEISAPLNSMFMSEIYNYGNRINATNKIEKLFKENNIEYVIVKGPIVAEYYPVAALRTMGDTDFLIKEKDNDKAYELIESLGFKKEVDNNEVAFFKDNLEVEVHNRLLYPGRTKREVEIEFCDRVWDYIKDNKVDDSYHYIYLLIHLKKHLIGPGVGIRQFLDLALMSKKVKLDFNYIDKELEHMDLLKFKEVCHSLIYKWFDINVEDNIQPINDEFYETATLKILKNGVHGFENEDNKMNKTFLKLSGENNKTNIFSKIRYIFISIFPSYKKLRLGRDYKFLDGKPYLLPIAWIWRLYLAIVYKKAGGEIKKVTKTALFSDSELDKRKKERDNWGL